MWCVRKVRGTDAAVHLIIVVSPHATYNKCSPLRGALIACPLLRTQPLHRRADAVLILDLSLTAMLAGCAALFRTRPSSKSN
jgi:hypothetical protein